MADSLARREREALCDLALELGPGAPTLCAGWDARELVVHLLVRERRPWAVVGSFVPPLSGVTERESARLRERSFPDLVARLRDPGGSVFAVRPLDAMVNAVEHVVHHEDLRRAQPGWEPRELPSADLDLLWARLRTGGGMLVRGAGVPVVLRREDDGRTATLRRGNDPVVVSGPVVELLMFAFGRDEVRDLTFEGPSERVTGLRTARRGI